MNVMMLWMMLTCKARFGGDRDVSFNNDVSDDGELVGAVSMNQDNVMTKVQCTSEENLVQGATNAEKSTLPGNDNEIM